MSGWAGSRKAGRSVEPVRQPVQSGAHDWRHVAGFKPFQRNTIMNTTITPENLPQIIWQNHKVITTELLAHCYGAQEKQIRQNYANNKTRFIEGKHFFKLEGEALRTFKQAANTEASSHLADWFKRSGLDQAFGGVDKIDSVRIASNVNSLMLWTEKGAVRHAKILDSDKAWDVQEVLEEIYFHPERKISSYGIPAELKSQLEALQAEILRTNPRLQDVLNLTRLGYSQARIGEMLGLGHSTVFKAAKRLRQCGFVVCADAARLPVQGGAQ